MLFMLAVVVQQELVLGQLGHYVQIWGPGTQGPKLACTVRVHTVVSSLGKYPGSRGLCL